jgi:hypothetical protein
MILRRDAEFFQIKSTILSIVDMHAADSWVVFDPLFLAFETEEEYERREISLPSNEAAFRLSGREMLAMIESEKIGFDWTDFAIERDAVLDGAGRFTCYVQCVDGLVWYVLSEDEGVINFLCSQGFAVHDSESLPFPRKSLAVS